MSTPRRQGTKQKSVPEFEVKYVMKCLQALDTTQDWNSKSCFCMYDTLHVPMFKPEEFCQASVVDQIAALEHQLREVHGDVVSNKIQITCADADIKKTVTSRGCSYSLRINNGYNFQCTR